MNKHAKSVGRARPPRLVLLLGTALVLLQSIVLAETSTLEKTSLLQPSLAHSEQLNQPQQLQQQPEPAVYTRVETTDTTTATGPKDSKKNANPAKEEDKKDGGEKVILTKQQVREIERMAAEKGQEIEELANETLGKVTLSKEQQVEAETYLANLWKGIVHLGDNEPTFQAGVSALTTGVHSTEHGEDQGQKVQEEKKEKKEKKPQTVIAKLSHHHHKRDNKEMKVVDEEQEEEDQWEDEYNATELGKHKNNKKNGKKIKGLKNQKKGAAPHKDRAGGRNKNGKNKVPPRMVGKAGKPDVYKKGHKFEKGRKGGKNGVHHGKPTGPVPPPTHASAPPDDAAHILPIPDPTKTRSPTIHSDPRQPTHPTPGPVSPPVHSPPPPHPPITLPIQKPLAPPQAAQAPAPDTSVPPTHPTVNPPQAIFQSPQSPSIPSSPPPPAVAIIIPSVPIQKEPETTHGQQPPPPITEAEHPKAPEKAPSLPADKPVAPASPASPAAAEPKPKPVIQGIPTSPLTEPVITVPGPDVAAPPASPPPTTVVEGPVDEDDDDEDDEDDKKNKDVDTTKTEPDTNTKEDPTSTPTTTPDSDDDEEEDDDPEGLKDIGDADQDNEEKTGLDAFGRPIVTNKSPALVDKDDEEDDEDDDDDDYEEDDEEEEGDEEQNVDDDGDANEINKTVVKLHKRQALEDDDLNIQVLGSRKGDKKANKKADTFAMNADKKNKKQVDFANAANVQVDEGLPKTKKNRKQHVAADDTFEAQVIRGDEKQDQGFARARDDNNGMGKKNKKDKKKNKGEKFQDQQNNVDNAGPDATIVDLQGGNKAHGVKTKTKKKNKKNPKNNPAGDDFKDRFKEIFGTRGGGKGARPMVNPVVVDTARTKKDKNGLKKHRDEANPFAQPAFQPFEDKPDKDKNKDKNIKNPDGGANGATIPVQKPQVNVPAAGGGGGGGGGGAPKGGNPPERVAPNKGIPPAGGNKDQNSPAGYGTVPMFGPAQLDLGSDSTTLKAMTMTTRLVGVLSLVAIVFMNW